MINLNSPREFLIEFSTESCTSTFSIFQQLVLWCCMNVFILINFYGIALSIVKKLENLVELFPNSVYVIWRQKVFPSGRKMIKYVLATEKDVIFQPWWIIQSIHFKTISFHWWKSSEKCRIFNLRFKQRNVELKPARGRHNLVCEYLWPDHQGAKGLIQFQKNKKSVRRKAQSVWCRQSQCVVSVMSAVPQVQRPRLESFSVWGRFRLHDTFQHCPLHLHAPPGCKSSITNVLPTLCRALDTIILTQCSQCSQCSVAGPVRELLAGGFCE